MASRAEEIGQEALAVSRQLLTLLSAPTAEAATDDLESLVARCEGLLNEMQQLLGGGKPPEAIRPLLEALSEQQRAVEAALTRQMQLVQKAMHDSQAVRANLASFRRVVDSGPRSRFLDQKR